MQTFLPYADFIDSAYVLDRQRLGKQRVEVKQIFNALEGNSKGWTNHPATRMWRGFEPALALYGVTMCAMWADRGYVDNLLPFFAVRLQVDAPMPPWMGDPDFHRAHKSNLIRKDPVHYGHLWPEVPDDLPYLWPSTKTLIATPL